jgi:hypothetical protein
VLETGNRTNESNIRAEPPDIIRILIPSICEYCFHEDTGIACETGIVGHECNLLYNPTLCGGEITPSINAMSRFLGNGAGETVGLISLIAAGTLAFLLLDQHLK